jgi:hypothetical protein
MKFPNLLKSKNKNNFPAHKHEIEYAFTSGGIEYYQFTDFSNMPPLRGLKTMVFYEEMRLKCTMEFLDLHTKAVDEILNSTKINIFELKKLNDQLKQRLNIALDTELIFKIASIMFFDKNEDFTDYDFDYNAKKVLNWKNNDGADFFLHKPLQEILPILKDVNENLAMYSKVVEQMNTLHLENLLQNLPSVEKERLKNKSYMSAVVIPQNSKV